MQDQPVIYRRLQIQCFLQCADGKVTCDMSVGYAGYYTPVIQIYDCTVIAYIVVFQKQIGKIRTPFLIWLFSSEILKELVSKNPVWFTVYIFRLFPTNDRAQTISVFIYL